VRLLFTLTVATYRLVGIRNLIVAPARAGTDAAPSRPSTNGRRHAARIDGFFAAG